MEINQYPVTASEMKDLSFLDIDQYVSAGVYQSQKVPVSLVKALMLSENIEQTNVVAAQALVAGSDLVSLKTYILDDADGGGRIIKVLAAAGVTNQFYQFAIDVTTGEIGTYDITTDVFTLVSGNALITPITVAELQTLEVLGTLNINALYIVTDAFPYKLMCKVESGGVLSRTAEIIDSTLSGQVLYDLQGNTWLNGAIYDGLGNTWNGTLPTSSITLGAGCAGNTFNQEVRNIQLGADSSGNIFEYLSGSGGSITCGDSAVNNTFKQGTEGFTFGDGLQNVIIEAGVFGDDYSALPDYDFLYNKTYSSTIFQSGGINYHRYFDIANDRIEITDLATPSNITYIGGGGATPDIQQVLDTGNTSTTSIKIDSGTGNYVDVKDSNILMEDSSGNALTIYPNSITIQNPSFGAGTIKATTLANNVFFELPNKPAGTETFAMMSDVVAGSGDVVGPASAVDNNIATFDGTTGKLIQDGGTTIADINTNAVDRITVKLAESITKGQAVYISSANGTNIIVSKASNLTEATSSKTLGLLETSGATNAIVNVVTSGLLDGLNTSAATIGDAVWLGTSGNLLFGLANKPYAPAHLVYIGVVSRVSATVGEIIVSPQNGFELKEIHDVFAQTPAAKDGLFYNTSTSLWEARPLVTADISNFVENISLQDGGSSIAATTYTLELFAAYAYTINQLKIISASGTCTVAVKINGVDVTGISAVAVSSTIATGTATAANTVAIGDKVTLVTTSNSALTNLQASLKTTRI
jgi:hypothetical protein